MRAWSAAFAVEPPERRSAVPVTSWAIALTMHVDVAGLVGFACGVGGPKKQLASSAQASACAPQSASDVHAPMPSVPVLPLMQCLAGPAPRVQSAGPDPSLPLSVSERPEMPVTSRTDVAPSARLTGGSAVALAPPT